METEAQPSSPALFEYGKEKTFTDTIIDGFSEEITRCEKRRDIRDFEVNVNMLRNNHVIGEDETKIPIRRIHSSILRVKPQMDAYLVQSRRLLIFKDKEQPGTPCEDVEIAFSEWMRYSGWEHPWHQMNDGTCLHGGNAIEVVYDTSKPLHCRIDFVARDDLMFSLKTKDIQCCERVVRKFCWYPFELESYATTYGFNPNETDLILKEFKDKPNDTVEVYRVWVKRKGQVWIFWYYKAANTFLKDPMPLESPLSPDKTVKTVYTQYPIWFNTFLLTEGTELLKCRGLAYWQLPSQEAETELITSNVNSGIKAAKIYASQEAQPGSLTDIQQTTPIKGNIIRSAPVKYSFAPMPDGQILKLAQYLNTEFTADLGLVNFAAMNRPDSRKTKGEIDASMTVATQTSSGFLSPISITATGAYTLCWEIGRAAILRGDIANFPVPVDKVAKRYNTFSAGSVDYVQRQEKKNTLMTLLPQLGGTPFGQALLQLLLKNFLPEEADQLMAQQPDKAIIQSLAQALMEFMQTSQLTPEENARLTQILAAAQQSLGGSPPGTSGPMEAGPDIDTAPEAPHELP